MTKLVGRDGNVQAVDIGSKSYYANRKGSYNVENKEHIKALKREGFAEASLMGHTTDHSIGFTCVECGFGSWFAKCSRCGHDNARDTPTDGNS
jgi:hypothetical protein